MFSIEKVCGLENNPARCVHGIEYDSICRRKGEKVYSHWVDRIDNRQVVDGLCAVLIDLGLKGEVDDDDEEVERKIERIHQTATFQRSVIESQDSQLGGNRTVK